MNKISVAEVLMIRQKAEFAIANFRHTLFIDPVKAETMATEIIASRFVIKECKAQLGFILNNYPEFIGSKLEEAFEMASVCIEQVRDGK